MPSTVTCFLSVQSVKIKHCAAGLEAEASVLSWPKQFVLSAWTMPAEPGALGPCPRLTASCKSN